MVFLGLFIVMAAILLGGELIRENSSSAHVTLFDSTVPFISTDAEVFAAGAAVSALFFIGLLIASRGVRRALRDGRDLDELRDDHAESVAMLIRENAGMRRELQRYRDEGVLDTRTSARPVSGIGTVYDAMS